MVAARHMGLTLSAFEAALEQLVARNFPRADPSTGNYDLDAIDAWRRSRYPQLYGIAAPTGARDAKDVVRARLTVAAVRDG